MIDPRRFARLLDGGARDRAADQRVDARQRRVRLVRAVHVIADPAVPHFLHHAQPLPHEALAARVAVAQHVAPYLGARRSPADGVVFEARLDDAARVLARHRDEALFRVEREALAQVRALALVADVAPRVVLEPDVLPDLQSVALDQPAALARVVEQVAGRVPREPFLGRVRAGVPAQQAPGRVVLVLDAAAHPVPLFGQFAQRVVAVAAPRVDVLCCAPAYAIAGCRARMRSEGGKARSLTRWWNRLGGGKQRITNRPTGHKCTSHQLV